MILYLILLINYLLLAHATTLPPPLEIVDDPSLYNLTSSQFSLVSNLSVNGYGLCTRIPRWTEPAMEPDDCRGVLQLFYHETMSDGGKGHVEFLSPGTQRTKHMKKQMTPRKYTYRSCTLAIVIIQDFPMPQKLPGGYKTGPPTDWTTYFRLNRVAAKLVESCVIGNGQAGWQYTGRRSGIGIFVWSTDSLEDKEIEDDSEQLVLPALEAGFDRDKATGVKAASGN